MIAPRRWKPNGKSTVTAVSFFEPRLPTKRLLLVSCLSAALFASKGAAAYRTAEDLPSFAGSGPIGWHVSAIQFVLSDVPPASLLTQDVVQAVDSAGSTWAATACSAPNIHVTRQV